MNHEPIFQGQDTEGQQMQIGFGALAGIPMRTTLLTPTQPIQCREVGFPDDVGVNHIHCDAFDFQDDAPFKRPPE